MEAVNSATGVLRETTTDTTGFYELSNMPPASYDFTVTFVGFATAVSRGVPLLVDQNATVDFQLSAGTVRQEVTVTAQAPMANLTNATVGTVVDSAKVAQLPLNGRQFTGLILLTPGVAPMSGGQHQVYELHTEMGAISPAVNGMQSDMNNFTIDGVENNELFLNFAAIIPPPDAIQEFAVQTNMSSGEFGRGGGANVNVVTKSGSNEFHGDAWEFLRNTDLNARNFFNPDVSTFHQNQFGGTLGGPIRRNKIWAFGWYEGFRKTKGSTILSQVPTAGQLNGDLSAFAPIFNPFTTRQAATDAQGNPIFTRDPFAGNQIPTGLLNPTALAVAKLAYPQPNYSGSGGINYLNSAPSATTDNQTGARIDTELSPKMNLFGRFTWEKGDRVTPAAVPISSVHNRQFDLQQVLGLTRTISPTTVLDLHAQYLRTYISEIIPAVPGTFLIDNGIARDWPANGGTPLLLPNMSISDITSVAGSLYSLPGGPINDFEYAGSVTKIAGKHTLHAGASLMRTWVLDNCTYADGNFDQSGTLDPQNPGTTGSGLASFLLGVPTSADRLAGDAIMTFQTTHYGAYVDDVWKATPKLTVTLGMRYEYSSPFHETRSREGSLDLANSTPTKTVWMIEKGAKPPLVDLSKAQVNLRYVDAMRVPQRKDFAPRVALAYRLGRDVAIRSGYGIFYDFNQSDIQGQQDIMGQWPFGFADFTPSDLNAPTIANPTPQHIFGVNLFPPFVPSEAPPSGPAFAAPIPSDQQRPYVQVWDFGIEKSFRNDWLASATYIGSKGTHIEVVPAINVAATPGPGPIAPRAPLPQFAPVRVELQSANSSYQALEVKGEKRFSKGLSFLASYTYEKSIDQTSASFGTTQPGESNPLGNDLKSNRGPSDFDLRHNFVFSYVYDLPFGEGKAYLGSFGWLSRYLIAGWQSTGILSLHSGFPFSISAPFDVANIGNKTGQRPMVVGSLFPAGFNQSLSEWFNTSALTLIPYTFGDMGRNVLRQDSFKNFDFGLFKQTRVTERVSTQFRAEFFNLFNHPNFLAPNVSMASSSFGKVLSASDPRFVQFGLKVMF